MNAPHNGHGRSLLRTSAQGTSTTPAVARLALACAVLATACGREVSTPPEPACQATTPVTTVVVLRNPAGDSIGTQTIRLWICTP